MTKSGEIIYLNSSARVSGSIYNATFQLPQDVIHCKSNQHVKIKLVFFMTPHSWYNISSTRNSTWTLIEDDEEIMCSVTNGNYDVKELALAIGTELTAQSQKGETYVCTWNSITGKHTITASGGTATAISLSLLISPQKQNMFLGSTLI